MKFSGGGSFGSISMNIDTGAISSKLSGVASEAKSALNGISGTSGGNLKAMASEAVSKVKDVANVDNLDVNSLIDKAKSEAMSQLDLGSITDMGVGDIEAEVARVNAETTAQVKAEMGSANLDTSEFNEIMNQDMSSEVLGSLGDLGNIGDIGSLL